MSAELATHSFSYPGFTPENLSLEDLRKNPLVQQFAGISEEVTKHHATLGLFSNLCKMICGGGPE
ncbi:hypothetical protein [Methanosarcina sp. WWM596]|uniref:hypothetical protein n=1 Tax=Methanosarcina sp. WWM596 TaxID=1434103 RepID=UPI00064EB4F3|nr:hypothetical protein [Methanosarcina sp. WWM596]